MTIDTNDFRERAKRGDISISECIALCDEIDRLRAKPKPQGKTVRVKIAVAVDKNGDWNAFGGEGVLDRAAMESAVTELDFGEASYWLTADLPIPEETDIVAEVER